MVETGSGGYPRTPASRPGSGLPQDFDDKKEHYFQELGQPVDADHFTQRIKIDLRAALDAFDRTLLSSKDVALRSRGGKTQISLKPLGAQDDLAMPDALKKEMARRWPMTSLLDVLKEVDLRIGFTRSFPTAAARQTLPEDEVLRRLLLALYGIGTNVGLKGVAAGPHNVAYKELLYIRQRFIHKNALRAATRAIADATNRVRATDIWGKGNELVSNRRDDQEISVLSLHLLQASMVYVNTLMIQDVLADQAWRKKMTARDMAALNPLPHSHIARVSTSGQNLESQIEHLQVEGCDKIFQEKLTWFDRQRPQLEKCWVPFNPAIRSSSPAWIDWCDILMISL